jgi:hypothetical protein
LPVADDALYREEKYSCRWITRVIAKYNKILLICLLLYKKKLFFPFFDLWRKCFKVKRKMMIEIMSMLKNKYLHPQIFL